MSKKIYVAKVEYEFVLVADDEADAMNEAEYLIHGELDEEPTTYISKIHRHRLDGKSFWYLPNGYELTTLPWGTDDSVEGDKTIGEYLEEQETAELIEKNQLKIPGVL